MIETFIEYFRALAVSHHLIQHDVAAETGNGDPAKKRFTIFGNNEVIDGLRSSIGTPALLLELPDISLGAEIVYDVRVKPQAAFMVVDHAATGDFADEQRAYVNAFKIVEDLLKKIWQDHYGTGKGRCTTPFKLFDFDKLTITPTGKVFTGEFGWYVQFYYTAQDSMQINVPPEEGAFI